MKKLITFILVAFLTLTCFTGCDSFEKNKGVTCKKYENCAVFTFANFSERQTVSFKLKRKGLSEGAIYYQINLEDGALSIDYKSIINTLQPLGEFSANEKMPINGCGGYVEGNEVTVIFESASTVNGEIIIAFTEDALKAVHGNLQRHEHTVTYTSAGKIGHFANYTCGCPSQEGTTPHYDENTDYICDYCKCDMTEFADEWQYDETHHWYISDDEAVYCYGEHESWDNNLNCDICGYNITLRVVNDILLNQAGCEWLNEITAENIEEIKILQKN